MRFCKLTVFYEKIIKNKFIFKDSDTILTVNEFTACLSDCTRIQGEPEITRENAELAAFQRLDLDKSETLSSEEFSLKFPEDHDEL